MIEERSSDQAQKSDEQSPPVIGQSKASECAASPLPVPAENTPSLPNNGRPAYNSEKTDNYAKEALQEFSAGVSEDSSMKPYEKRMFWMTVVGIAVGILTAVFFCSQLLEMRTQTALIVQQSQIENAGASHRTAETFRQLNIAQKQAQAAQDSLATIREQMRLDQRAWVGLVHTETMGGKQSEDRSTFSYDYVRVSFRNSGKTPALNVSVQRIMTGGKAGIMIGGKPEKIPDFDEEVMATERFHQQMTAELIRENPKDAEQIRKARRGVSPTGVLSALSPAGRAIAPTAELVFDWHALGPGSLRDSKTGVPTTTYLLGKVTYNDIFPGTKRHTTKFCLMWHETGFIMCPGGGNWMD
ncbi:MAG: hypothetical protein ABSA70_09575 [Terriglobia bacterium]